MALEFHHVISVVLNPGYMVESLEEFKRTMPRSHTHRFSFHWSDDRVAHSKCGPHTGSSSNSSIPWDLIRTAGSTEAPSRLHPDLQDLNLYCYKIPN